MTNISAAQGIILPAQVVGYIASFIKTNFDSNLLLNMYKAFEIITYKSITYEDSLRYYKDDVQSYIAHLAEDGVIFDERDAECGLTRREIMYIFDCYYCDPNVIMYGEKTYEDVDDNSSIVNTARMQHIYREFMDCSEYTETLALPYLGIQFDLSYELNIKMYKYIRLLEEALRLKSTGLIAYMKDKMIISPDMLLYIYIKHNHQLYAPDWYSLAADDILLELLKEVGVLPIVLGLAISGQRRRHSYNEADLKNVVLYNLAVVKKIVPQHISAASISIPYEDYCHASGEDHTFVKLLTPYMYWQSTYKDQVRFALLGEAHKTIEVVWSEEIGAYLQGFE